MVLPLNIVNNKSCRYVLMQGVVFGCVFFFFKCNAQQPSNYLNEPVVKLTVINSPGFTIPHNFTGISFESDAIAFNHRGVKGYFFSSANKQLINLFANIGIRSLRMGGGTVDMHPGEGAYNQMAIDSLFGFAKTVGVKVIYSLPLLNANDTTDAITAQYIWTHYKDYLDCFSIGNEPNCPPYKEAAIGAIKSY